MSKKHTISDIVVNKNNFKKNVEKNLKNVLTIKFVFGIITKSLVTERATRTKRTLTNKQ